MGRMGKMWKAWKPIAGLLMVFAACGRPPLPEEQQSGDAEPAVAACGAQPTVVYVFEKACGAVCARCDGATAACQWGNVYCVTAWTGLTSDSCPEWFYSGACP